MTDFENKVYSALIVDDDEINLEILSDYLEAAGDCGGWRISSQGA